MANPHDGGPLPIDFPDQGGENPLENISWDASLETFNERELAFLYQDKKTDGHESRFSKSVERGEEYKRPEHTSHDHAAGRLTRKGLSRRGGQKHRRPHNKA